MMWFIVNSNPEIISIYLPIKISLEAIKDISVSVYWFWKMTYRMFASSFVNSLVFIYRKQQYWVEKSTFYLNPDNKCSELQRIKTSAVYLLSNINHVRERRYVISVISRYLNDSEYTNTNGIIINWSKVLSKL